MKLAPGRAQTGELAGSNRENEADGAGNFATQDALKHQVSAGGLKREAGDS